MFLCMPTGKGFRGPNLRSLHKKLFHLVPREDLMLGNAGKPFTVLSTNHGPYPDAGEYETGTKPWRAGVDWTT